MSDRRKGPGDTLSVPRARHCHWLNAALTEAFYRFGATSEK